MLHFQTRASGSDRHEDPAITISTHYYSKRRRTFETSLDVYSPRHITGPTVILVVGSAWMGHVRAVYYGTSWWNASGPRSVAAAGSVCICVRHPGAFVQLPHLSASSWALLLVSFITTACCFLSAVYVCLVALASAVVLLWVYWAGRGAAKFSDMLSFVAEAVQYVMDHQQGHFLPDDGNHRLPVLFGGYSSGAHVAATLLQQWKEYHLPLQKIDGIVFVSGVLAVRPLPTTQDKPRWLTDLLLHLIWGYPDAVKIPSPAANANLIPKLNHLLIGCQSETFGLPLLDVFFASQHYAEQAVARGIPLVCRTVRSDHWSILSCRQFQEVLAQELPRLVSMKRNS